MTRSSPRSRRRASRSRRSRWSPPRARAPRARTAAAAPRPPRAAARPPRAEVQPAPLSRRARQQLADTAQDLEERGRRSADGAQIASPDGHDPPPDRCRARDRDGPQPAVRELGRDRRVGQQGDAQPLADHLLGGVDVVELHDPVRRDAGLAKERVGQVVVARRAVEQDEARIREFAQVDPVATRRTGATGGRPGPARRRRAAGSRCRGGAAPGPAPGRSRAGGPSPGSPPSAPCARRAGPAGAAAVKRSSRPGSTYVLMAGAAPRTSSPVPPRPIEVTRPAPSSRASTARSA